MLIIGRKKEQMLLADCLSSPGPEFLAVFGQRLVGKILTSQEFGFRIALRMDGVWTRIRKPARSDE